MLPNSEYQDQVTEALAGRLQYIAWQTNTTAEGTTYTFSYVKDLSIARDPLNDLSWEVDYSGLALDTPRIKVRQRFSGHYRLFLYDRAWDKSDTIDLGQPFRVVATQQDSLYRFTFFGSPPPYELWLLNPRFAEHVLWRATGIEADTYAVHRDTLLAALLQADAFAGGQDTLSLAFYALERPGSVAKQRVTGGSIRLPRPASGNLWYWIIGGLIVIGGGTVLVFWLRRRYTQQRKAVFHATHEYNT